MIDVCMTATIRPKIVLQTLRSFYKRMFRDKDRYRLIINVDPIGENAKREEVVDVCKNFFTTVIYNFPSAPSFPAAVKWVWSQSNTDFVFHLEDDWLLTSKIDMDDMIRILNKDQTIPCLRLSKYKIPNSNRVVLFGARYNYTGDNYFVTENKNQFGLNPVLIKRDFIKEALPLLSDTFNPEKQFRLAKNEKMNKLINSWKYAIYAIPGSGATVVDNGASWRATNRFRKPPGSFLVWEKA